MNGKKIGIVTRRQPPDRQARTLARLRPIVDELGLVGVSAEFVEFTDVSADRFRDYLLDFDGVLVWVDPLEEEQDRSILDGILRDVALRGAWVSAHPDVIQRLGTKEILFEARELPFGSETDVYRTWTEFRAAFPERLAAGESRVLKRHRGNAGIGVWKVTAVQGRSDEDRMVVEVQDAHPRGVSVERLALTSFIERCAAFFEGGGFLLDQPFEKRIADGLVRCYLVGTRVIGFSTQEPGAGQLASGRVFGLPSAKTMYDAHEKRFASLRRAVEANWLPQLLRLVGISASDLPLLWDADFLFGSKDEAGDDTYVLCEINMSCVTPFPDSAPPAIAQAVRERFDKAASD